MVERVWAIAEYELRLQLRSVAFWLMLTAFIVLAGVFARGQVTGYTYVSAGTAAGNIGSYISSFVCFLLPFLFLMTFQRDQMRKVTPLLWTRPISSLEYALGKGIGAVLVSFLVSWPAHLVGWIVASSLRGGLQPLDIWLMVLLIESAVYALVALATLFFIELMPISLLGMLISIGLTLYLNIVPQKSTVILLNLTAAGLYLSDSIGLGPDTPTVLWQRLTYLALGLLFLALLLLVYQARHRLGIARLRHWLSTAILLLLAIVLVMLSIGQYQNAVATARDPGPTGNPVNAETSQYHLQVTASPESGQVQGIATFLVTAKEKIGSTFTIGLNPGLHVQHITQTNNGQGSSRELAFTEKNGWTNIRTQDAGIQPGNTIQLTITYAGTMTLGRDYYASPIPGYGLDNGSTQQVDYFYLSYLGQGTGALLGTAGSWFPLPWTQQALGSYGTRLPIDEIDLRVPATTNVFCALAKPVRSADGQWQEIKLTPHASLPVAFVAMLHNAQTINLHNASFQFQGTYPDQTQLTTAALAIQETQALYQWFTPGEAGSALTVIRMPIIQIPFLGPGLLLLPENPATPPALPQTERAMARFNAGELAQAWWLNATPNPLYIYNSEPDLQITYAGTILLPYSHLVNMLSAYSAAVITDRVIGQGALAQEMNLCKQSYQASTQAPSYNNNGPLQMSSDQLITMTLQKIGIDGCEYSDLILYQMQQQIGPEKMADFLRNYATQHTHSLMSLHDFLKQASVLMGHDMVSEAASYICSGRQAGLADKSNPLGCITGELDA